MLTLQEELMLLALDDNAGKIVEQAQRPLKLGLVSAVLTELTLTGKLSVDAAGHVTAITTAPTGDSLTDEVLNRVRQTMPPRSAPAWLQTLPQSLRDVETRVMQRLVQRGAVQQKEARKFIFMKVTSFPQNNAGFEQNTRRRLRDVLIDNAQPDDRTMALIGLVKMCNLVETVFPYTDWNQARMRIDQLTNPQFAGWQYQSNPQGGYGYNAPYGQQQAQPMGAMGMMSGFVPALMFSMVAQSMFWGMGGWGMPGMTPGMTGDPAVDQFGEGANTEVGNEGDAGMDGGFDFGGDFGGEF
jgi:hypothetical protein